MAAYNCQVEVEDMERQLLDHSRGCDIQPMLDDDASDLPEVVVDIPDSDDAVEVVEVQRGCFQDDESDVQWEEEDLVAHYSARERESNSHCWICLTVRRCYSSSCQPQRVATSCSRLTRVHQLSAADKQCLQSE